VNAVRKVAITTGDLDGVGLEVAVKALRRIGPQRGVCFYLWRSPQAFQKKICQKLSSQFNQSSLVQVESSSSPALWVEEVAKLCLSNKMDSMVTGPLSKQEILRAGLKDIGHTDILKRVAKRSSAFMAFVGEKFNVLLVTAHIPLHQVSEHLTPSLETAALQIALSARQILSKPQQKKPLGVLGLNPHAGDRSLIGREESVWLAPLLQSFPGTNQLVGPLVPDVAFTQENWKKYSFFICQYHDQGLIPFKMAHGFDSGAHLTLGLPIRRSSVDHGTAKDLFGQNKARSGSMEAALRWGVRLAKS